MFIQNYFRNRKSADLAIPCDDSEDELAFSDRKLQKKKPLQFLVNKTAAVVARIVMVPMWFLLKLTLKYCNFTN